MNENGQIKPDVLKRLFLGKLCILDAKRLLASSKDRFSLARAALLYHDAAESIFAAITQHSGIHIKDSSSLPGILSSLTSGKIFVANTTEINQLNSLRIQVKHKGIFPDRETYGDIFAAVDTSLQRACDEYLNVDLSRVSLKDLISSDDVKALIESAEKHADEENFEESLKDVARCVYKIAESGDVFVQTLFRMKTEGADKSEEPIFPRIWSTENVVKLIEHGIDIGAYRTFKQLTPQFGVGLNGVDDQLVWGHDYGHEKNWNFENSRFCIDFCIDTALKFQEHRKQGLSLIHYHEAFVDVVTARKDGVEVWNAPEELAKVVTTLERKVVAHLKKGSQIQGSILPREVSSKAVLGSNEIVMAPLNFEAQGLWYGKLIVLSKNDVEVSRIER